MKQDQIVIYKDENNAIQLEVRMDGEIRYRYCYDDGVLLRRFLILLNNCPTSLIRCGIFRIFAG